MASSDVVFRSEALAGPAPFEELVERCRQGDPQAFARLVAVHEGMVFSLAVRLLGDVEEARDLSQEVFLQVYRTLSQFQGRSSLKTWIYRIVVNQCQNRRRWWRRRRREQACPLEKITAAEEAVLARGGPSPLEELERNERLRRVHRALLKVSFDHRAVLLLREVEGLPVETVAQALGVAEGTVKSRLARARDALRTALLEDTGDRR